LSDDEVKKMVNDAESHASEDKARREEIETRNQADSQAYSMEKLLNENKDAVDEADRQTIEQAIKDVRKALEGDNIDEITRRMQALEAASHKMAEAMYKKASAQGGAGPAEPGGPAGGGAPPPPRGGDDVIDAEVVEEN
ncbi:MAG: Hsp70 family protein, partial [Deltaproteobacteria bacterium]|nr:Hsp70 family protein [Deltaproteobacteria bacterium]